MAVRDALTNPTIRGGSINVLRRCLLFACQWDVDLEARWISTKETAVADALSREDNETLAKIVPYLVYLGCSLTRPHFLRFSKQSHER